MVEVETNDAGGLDEKETDDMLENLLLYQGALNKCNATIEEFNKATAPK